MFSVTLWRTELYRSQLLNLLLEKLRMKNSLRSLETANKILATEHVESSEKCEQRISRERDIP